MNNFVRLGNVAQLTVGFVGTMASHYVPNGIPFLRSLNIKPFEISNVDLKFIKPQFNSKLSKSILKANDVVIVRTGVPGTCCVIPKEYEGCNCSDVVIVRPNTNKIDPHYLAAYINFFGKKQITHHKVGAVQQHFNVQSAEEMMIPLFNIELQKKIAFTLTSINEKIKNNKRINDNLEQQLRTIYDYWFTQFDFPDENGKPYRSSGGKMVWNDELKREIPKGWEVCSIARYTSIYQPKTISNALFDDNQPFYVYGGGGLIGKYKEYNHKESEVIISCRGNCGNIYYTMPQSWITGNAMVVTPTNSKLSKYYLFNYIGKYGVEKYLSGSVQKQLTRENLSLMPIIIPPKFLIDAFNQKVGVIFQDIIRNRREQDCLIKLRDWLLPMLMNGQATVAD